MNFGQALDEMKIGAKVRLPHWNKNTQIGIERTDDYTHAYFVVDSDNGSVPWIPTYPEMLSDKWELVRP